MKLLIILFISNKILFRLRSVKFSFWSWMQQINVKKTRKQTFEKIVIHSGKPLIKLIFPFTISSCSKNDQSYLSPAHLINLCFDSDPRTLTHWWIFSFSFSLIFLFCLCLSIKFLLSSLIVVSLSIFPSTKKKSFDCHQKNSLSSVRFFPPTASVPTSSQRFDTEDIKRIKKKH